MPPITNTMTRPPVKPTGSSATTSFDSSSPAAATGVARAPAASHRCFVLLLRFDLAADDTSADAPGSRPLPPPLPPPTSASSTAGGGKMYGKSSCDSSSVRCSATRSAIAGTKRDISNSASCARFAASAMSLRESFSFLDFFAFTSTPRYTRLRMPFTCSASSALSSSSMPPLALSMPPCEIMYSASRRARRSVLSPESSLSHSSSSFASLLRFTALPSPSTPVAICCSSSARSSRRYFWNLSIMSVIMRWCCTFFAWRSRSAVASSCTTAASAPMSLPSRPPAAALPDADSLCACTAAIDTLMALVACKCRNSTHTGSLSSSITVCFFFACGPDAVFVLYV
mmetsp:Transcript_25248/g.88071  ORF Transcript_25248/g.88071 Transcript_25248/m.88071 type:complete len:342 (-) Transcript_25248:1340-2365(-)